MINITATDVNNLRKATGAGMMDCKQALQEAEGDMEKAVDILRKKGQKVANKRSDRETNEGYVIAKVKSTKDLAAVLMLNCETDFVAKNDDFVAFAINVLDKAMAQKLKSNEEVHNMDYNGRTVAENLTDMVGKIGEKIELTSYDVIEAPVVFAYNHLGNKLATIMGLNKKEVADVEEIGKQVNMQIAAMSPVAIDKADVDPKIIEKEIEIGKDQARQEGKPEELIEKIALGKLNKFYKDFTLLNQDFVRDNTMTISQFLKKADKDLTVTAFKRISVAQ
jgi:elongation factor Ts